MYNPRLLQNHLTKDVNKIWQKQFFKIVWQLSSFLLNFYLILKISLAELLWSHWDTAFQVLTIEHCCPKLIGVIESMQCSFSAYWYSLSPVVLHFFLTPQDVKYSDPLACIFIEQSFRTTFAIQLLIWYILCIYIYYILSIY